MSTNESDDQILKRGQHLGELLLSEVRYVRSLDTLLTKYYRPLLQPQQEPQEPSQSISNSENNSTDNTNNILKTNVDNSKKNSRNSLSPSSSAKIKFPSPSSSPRDPDNQEEEIPRRIVQKIFPQDIQTIHDFHASILKDLKSRFISSGAESIASDEALDEMLQRGINIPDCDPEILKHAGRNVCIGDIFASCAPFFKIYSSYVAFYSKMNQELNMAQKAYPALKKFLQNTAQECGTPVTSFLVQPVQKLTRYSMLLRSLLEETPSDHPDHDQLAKAINKMKESSAYQDDKIQKVDTYEQVRRLALKYNLFDEIESHSRMVKTGKLKIKRGSKPEQEFKVYLLTTIIIAKRKTIEHTKLQTRQINVIKLDECQASIDEEQSTGIILQFGDNKWYLIAPNESERDDWISKLSDVIHQYRRRSQQSIQSIPISIGSSNNSISSISPLSKENKSKSVEIKYAVKFRPFNSNDEEESISQRRRRKNRNQPKKIIHPYHITVSMRTVMRRILIFTTSFVAVGAVAFVWWQKKGDTNSDQVSFQ